MDKNKLSELIRSLVKEYTGTGAGGGNATDGNDIPSPRPFADDVKELENYLRKNVYGGEGGHYSHHLAKNSLGLGRKKMGMFELKDYITKYLKEQAYGHATLTTQGQRKKRFKTKTGNPPGVLEQGDDFQQRRVTLQKQLVQVDIDQAEDEKSKAISAAAAQNIDNTPQIDALNKQIYDANENIVEKKRQRVDLKSEVETLTKEFWSIPAEEEERRTEALKKVYEKKDIQDKIKGEIEGLQKQRDGLINQKEGLEKQKNQGANTKQFDDRIDQLIKQKSNVGKQKQQTKENLLKQYENERKNINLMEQMDSYMENMRGSLKKFFEMFENGQTNEEVLQHYAKNGIQIPESFIQKTKKAFEQYKKLKLELGFMEQEAKDFKKSIDPTQTEETKQLSTKIFKK